MNKILLFPSSSFGADVYKATFEFEYDLNVSKTDLETTREQEFVETLELYYAQNILPRLDVNASFILDVQQQIANDGTKTTKLLPEIQVDGSADYWTLGFGVKRERESTSIPLDPASIQDSYFIEYILEPKVQLPDLKLRYALDTDKVGSTTDTADSSLEASTVYDLGEIVKIKVDYLRDESKDKLNADSDTLDENFKIEETIQYIFSSKIKFDFKHDFDKTTGATLLDNGGRTNETNTNKNTIDASLTYPIFSKTDFDANYKFTRDEDKIENSVQRSNVFNVGLSQEIGKYIDFSFSYNKSVEEQVGIGINSRTTNDSLSYDLNFSLLDLYDFTITYSEDFSETDDSIDVQNSGESASENFDFSVDFDPETFWVFTASYTWGVNREEGILRNKNRDISLKSDFDFLLIGLAFSADYSFSIQEDFTTPTDQKRRSTDFEFSIDYSKNITNTLFVTFSHQFARSVDKPDETIQRDDDTILSLSLDEPWEGSSFTLSLTRNATDTSGDDSGPDITSNISLGWSHTYEMIDLSLQYSFDRRNLSDDSETIDFQIGWLGLNFETELTYTFSKIYSTELNESHSVTLNFTMDI